jgi:hypothetical protein
MLRFFHLDNAERGHPDTMHSTSPQLSAAQNRRRSFPKAAETCLPGIELVRMSSFSTRNCWTASGCCRQAPGTQSRP